MDDVRFRERVRAWDARPGSLLDASYLGGYPHPLDAKLDALCALYIDAAPAQRRQLTALALPAVDSCGSTVAANNLLTYIRHCGRRIHAEGNTQPLRLAMAAAVLAGAQADERDLALAVVFLRAGATRAGISTDTALRLLDETLPDESGEDDIADGERIARRVLVGVWHSDEATITRILAYHVGTG